MKSISHTWKDQNALVQGALTLSTRLKNAGHCVLWAGGCVRDDLLGRKAKDIDIATDAPIERIMELFPRHVAVGKQFGVIVVPEQGINYEIAIFRQDATYSDGRHPDSITPSTPEVDASRRDFTINGLFFDPFQNQIIDYVNGLDDLSQKTLRAIGTAADRFEEDKLRLLRAVRFSVEFSFPMEAKTLAAVRDLAPKIIQVSVERIRDELTKMLTGRSPRDAIELLSETHLLPVILPEVEAFKGVEQPPEHHPEGDVWVHVLKMLSLCSYSSIDLVLGILFHDIAKPVTFERAADRIRFHNHQRIGVDMTEEILTRLKFPRKTIELTKDLVGQHMRFGDAHLMRQGRLKTFVLRDHFDVHLDLHRIDCLGSHGHLENYELCKKTLEDIRSQPQLAKPLISGSDLIGLGLKPGPEFKELLEKAREAQLEGIINTPEEAKAYIMKACAKK